MRSMSKICTDASVTMMRVILRRLPAPAPAPALAIARGAQRLLVTALALSLALLVIAPVAGAAPSSVESFDKSTWLALVRDAKQPAIVVFTSVTCTHCPGAIASMARQRAARRSQVPLLIVSMDADDDASLLRDAHYAPADRLFAFRGNPQALQFAVNPGWRGMTPYVAFVDGKGNAKFVLGEPKPAVLESWLK